jgi:hypothetical protein
MATKKTTRKRKSTAERKVIKIAEKLETIAVSGMDEIRSKLDVIDQYIWDKAIEGLSSPKATGKWPDFMNTLTLLGNKVKVASEESEIELDWDTCATSEALG